MVKIPVLLQREVDKTKLNQTCAKYLQGCHVDLMSLSNMLSIYCYRVHFLHMLSPLSTSSYSLWTLCSLFSSAKPSRTPDAGPQLDLLNVL